MSDGKWNKRKRDENMKILIKLKSVPCYDCGGTYPYYVMDFDHVRGIKVRRVSAMTDCNTDLMLAEVAKCDVVCSNCHRIRTFLRKHMPS